MALGNFATWRAVCHEALAPGASARPQPSEESHARGPMKLVVKYASAGTTLSVDAEPDMTVLQLKERIALQAEDVPAARQRLIYSGKVLKDTDTLGSYDVKDGHTVHMVRGAPPPGAAAPPPVAPASQPAAGLPAAGGMAAPAAAPFNPFMMGMMGAGAGAGAGALGAGAPFGAGGAAPGAGALPGAGMMGGMDPAQMMAMMQNPAMMQMAQALHV